MPAYACQRCGVITDATLCLLHRRTGSWSGDKRDRGMQARFRRAVLKRDGDRCTAAMLDGTRCLATTDLRACHLTPLSELEAGHPLAYDPRNGTTRCGSHDRASDGYAR